MCSYTLSSIYRGYFLGHFNLQTQGIAHPTPTFWIWAWIDFLAMQAELCEGLIMVVRLGILVVKAKLGILVAKLGIMVVKAKLGIVVVKAKL